MPQLDQSRTHAGAKGHKLNHAALRGATPDVQAAPAPSFPFANLFSQSGAPNIHAPNIMFQPNPHVGMAAGSFAGVRASSIPDIIYHSQRGDLEFTADHVHFPASSGLGPYRDKPQFDTLSDRGPAHRNEHLTVMPREGLFSRYGRFPHGRRQGAYRRTDSYGGHSRSTLRQTATHVG